jgi:hypothetical protein
MLFKFARSVSGDFFGTFLTTLAFCGDFSCAETTDVVFFLLLFFPAAFDFIVFFGRPKF